MTSSFVLLAPSMHWRCTQSKAKCTSCVSLQRCLQLHACIYKDIVQGVVALTFEIIEDWLLSPMLWLWGLCMRLHKHCIRWKFSHCDIAVDNCASSVCIQLSKPGVCPDTYRQGVLSPVQRIQIMIYTDTVQFSDWNTFNHGSCSASGEKSMVSWLQIFHKWKKEDCG